MLNSMLGRELGVNASLDYSADKYMSRLGDWEDYIVGSYLFLISEYF